jgi:class 3 adenylate cyclase
VGGLGNRTQELGVLHRWAAEALAGNPRLVVVEGAAGIGKSTVVGAFVDELHTASVQTLVGRCSQNSDLPLLAVAPVIDQLQSNETPRSSIGVLRAASDALGRLAVVQEVAQLLLEQAERQPVALVLEDVQWIDDATLDLITYVATTIAGRARDRPLSLLVIVTFTPTPDATAAHRLTRQLISEVAGRRLVLEGLNELGVFSMLTDAYARPSSHLLGEIVEITHGHPGRIETLLATLRREGQLEIRDGELHARGSLPRVMRTDAGEPADVPSLSPEARELLLQLGLLRDNGAELVRSASALSDVAFDAALDELVASGVVTFKGDRVDVARDDVARAMVSRLAPSRRNRMRREIAQRLNACSAEASSDLSPEIVHQSLLAGSGDELLRSHVIPAADSAFRSGAWREALRWYQAALDASFLSPSDRAATEAQAAIASFRALDGAGAIAHSRHAIQQARGIGDDETWGTAALVAARVGIVYGGEPADVETMLRDFLTGVDGRVPNLCAEAHCALSESAIDHFRLDVAWDHAREARALANLVADERSRHITTSHVEFVSGLTKYLELDLASADKFLNDGVRAARQGSDSLMESWALGRLPLTHWASGNLSEADRAANEAMEFNRSNGWWIEYAMASAVATGIAVARGDAIESERRGNLAADAHRWANHDRIGGMLFTALACMRAQRGDFAGAHAALDGWEKAEPGPRIAFFHHLVDAYRRDNQGGRARATLLDVLRSTPRGRPDLIALSAPAFAIEFATLARDAPAVASDSEDIPALSMLEDSYHSGVRFLPGWSLFLPRVLGSAYRLCGDRVRAEQWLRRALRDARHAKSPVELARVELELAYACSGHDRPRSQEHLRTAIDSFRRLGLAPMLRDSIDLAHSLDVQDSDDIADLETATRVILVTDIVDSTPLAHHLGDRRFVALLREHNLIVRRSLKTCGGIEFKHTGDGIAAWFLDAEAAIECALAVRDALLTQEGGIGVRIGIASGEVVVEGNDLFGVAVITAFRVCDAAEPGGVLVAESVPRLVRSSSAVFTPLGSVMLKGFQAAQKVFAVTRANK